MLKLKTLMPAILLGSLALDVAVRLLPFDPWSPSAYLAAARWTRLDGTWQPGTRYDVPQAYGELTRIGRMRDMAQYHHETFSVDALGYRNASDLTGRTSIILAGDSFGLGLSLSDEQTFATQLGSELGEPVYNAALTLGSFGVTRLRTVARSLGITRGRVVFEYVNRDPLTIQSMRQPLTGFDPVRERLFAFRPTAVLWPYLKGLGRPTLHMAARDRLGWLVENDRLLPNPSVSNVWRETLRNGRPMLFLPADAEFSAAPRSVDRTVSALAWLKDEIRPDGLELFVVLVPTSYTTYAPLLQGEARPDFGGQYLGELEGRLRESGVSVLNVLPALRTAAAAGLDSGEYVYWLDDPHWNPRGVSIVAKSVAAWMGDPAARGRSR